MDDLVESVRSQFRPVLVLMSGPRVGDRIPLRGNFVVGRAPDAELRLDDGRVSWIHARFEDRGDGWAIVDEGSTNGTLLNGKRIDVAKLAHGDKLVFGKTLLRFELQDEADRVFGEAVERMISVDELSGLYVPRRFEQELQELTSRAAATREPLGMLVFDLDGIKAINDTHGHAFGAYTIGRAGHLIGEVLAGRGVACRWGGDEFTVALPGCDLDATIAIGEEIRLAIERYVFEREGVRLRPGVSGGAAAFPTTSKEPGALFHLADEALYRAKRAGKNRISV